MRAESMAGGVAVAQPAGYIEHGSKAFRHTNLALFAAGFATFALLYCVQPLMPEFSRDFHVAAAISSLSLSFTTGVLAFAMLVAGAFSDAYGRKPVMVASLLASGLLTMALAFTHSWHGLLLMRALMGLTLSGLPAIAMAYLSEEMAPRSIGLAMGLFIGGSALGGMGGRLIAGVLSEWVSWRFAVGAVGLTGLIAGLIFWHALPPSRHFESRPLRLGTLVAPSLQLLRDRGLPWMFAAGFLLMGTFVTVYNYTGYRLLGAPYGLSQGAVGAIFAVYLVGIFSSAWMGHLAGRLGRRKVLWTSFALMLLGIGLTLLRPLPVVVFGLAVLTFGFFGGHSIVSSWVGRRAGGSKAQASSLYLFSYYMGSSVAGFCGGLFWSSWAWAGVAGFTGLLTLAGLLVALRLARLEPLPSTDAGGVELSAEASH
ncbi:MFS transporter [Acidihalobacter prosperus]